MRPLLPRHCCCSQALQGCPRHGLWRAHHRTRSAHTSMLSGVWAPSKKYSSSPGARCIAVGRINHAGASLAVGPVVGESLGCGLATWPAPDPGCMQWAMCPTPEPEHMPANTLRTSCKVLNAQRRSMQAELQEARPRQVASAKCAIWCSKMGLSQQDGPRMSH